MHSVKDISMFSVGTHLTTCCTKKIAGIPLGQKKQIYKVISVYDLKEVSNDNSIDAPLIREGEEFITTSGSKEVTWIVQPNLTPKKISEKEIGFRGFSSLSSPKQFLPIGISIILLLCTIILNPIDSQSTTITSLSRVPLFLISTGLILGVLYLILRHFEKYDLADKTLKIGLVVLLASLLIPFFYIVLVFLVVGFLWYSSRILDDGPSVILEDVWMAKQRFDMLRENYSDASPVLKNAFEVKELSDASPKNLTFPVDEQEDL